MRLLTTKLARHAQEFISAAWRVCETADIVKSKPMGAALTYARGTGLLTLVGIAGEDDLNAPDGPGEPQLPRLRGWRPRPKRARFDQR